MLQMKAYICTRCCPSFKRLFLQDFNLQSNKTETWEKTSVILKLNKTIMFSVF